MIDFPEYKLSARKRLQRLTENRAAQRFALPALGRAAERCPTGKKLRRRKMLGIAPESPASDARFVRRFFVF
jgi:hypothetical protein